MYIRSKTIKGHTYYYLVEGRREGKTVRQKVIRYLGKSPTGYTSGTGGTTAPVLPQLPTETALGTTSPQTPPVRHAGSPPRRTHFIPVIGKDYRAVFTSLFHRFGVTSIRYNLRRNSGTRGLINNTYGTVAFTARPSAHVMAHELGHRIDYLLKGAAPRGTSAGSDAGAFQLRIEEYRKVADYFYSTIPLTSRDRLANLQRWHTTHPDYVLIRREANRLDSFYERYAYQRKECFADMIALSLVEPRKAKQLAPKTYHWLIKTLSEDATIRQGLIDAGCFQLGTTHKPSPLTAEEKQP
jgi:hypothetical protein